MPSNKQLSEVIKCIALCLGEKLGERHTNRILKTLSEPDFEEVDKKLDEIVKIAETYGGYSTSSTYSIRNNPLELQPFEIELLKKCLVYCKHRINEHLYSGIRKSGVKAKDVELLLNKF